MGVSFNGYTIEDLLKLENQLEEYKSFVSWCLGMASCHGDQYCRVKQEILMRFPELQEEAESLDKQSGPV